MSLTSTITNTVKDLNGTPIVGVSVDILLKPSGAFRIDDSTEITPKETVVTDGNGTWSVNLERTSNISPANSHYLVTEKIPVANGGPSTWAIQVGAANQTLLAALVTPAPDASSSLFLTQAAGDARYQQLGFGATPSTINPNDVASAGTSILGTRIDHEHAVEVGTMKLRGTSTTRLALTGMVAGQEFFETDTLKTYEYTGTSWILCPIILHSEATFSFNNSNAETDMVSAIIPGNLVKSGNRLILRAHGDFLNNTGGGLPLTNRIKLGASTILSGSTTPSSTTVRYKWMLEAIIVIESLTAQRVVSKCEISAVGSGAATDWTSGLSIGLLGTNAVAEDMTVDKTLVFSAQFLLASANAEFRRFAYSVELLKDT